MKRMIAALTVAALAMSFAACSSSDDKETKPESTQSSSTAATEAATEATKESEIQTEKFTEIVLVDNDDVTVKITGIDEDTIWGFALNIYLENKTDKKLMYIADSVSINGFMCDPYWAVTVAPGMKSNTEISWFENDLKDNNITQVDDLDFTLRIYDADDLMAEDLFKDTFSVHLHG